MEEGSLALYGTICMRNLCLNDNDDTTTSKQIYVFFVPAMVPHRTSLTALRSGELESDCREVTPRSHSQNRYCLNIRVIWTDFGWKEFTLNC